MYDELLVQISCYWNEITYVHAKKVDGKQEVVKDSVRIRKGKKGVVE